MTFGMIESTDWPLESWTGGARISLRAPHVVVVAGPPAAPLDPTLTQVVRMQVARPPHFAEREEIDAALKAGTAEALLLFIDRHPRSRYRDEAEAALRQLGQMPPTR